MKNNNYLPWVQVIVTLFGATTVGLAIAILLCSSFTGILLGGVVGFNIGTVINLVLYDKAEKEAKRLSENAAFKKYYHTTCNREATEDLNAGNFPFGNYKRNLEYNDIWEVST